MANVDEWEIPTDKLGRKLRKTQYVVSPEHSSSDNEISTDTEEDNEPLIKIAKRFRRERAIHLLKAIFQNWNFLKD